MSTDKPTLDALLEGLYNFAEHPHLHVYTDDCSDEYSKQETRAQIVEAIQNIIGELEVKELVGNNANQRRHGRNLLRMKQRRALDEFLDSALSGEETK